MSQLSREEIIGRVASRRSLRGLNLLRAELAGAELRGADLVEANLRMANLENANLVDAGLSGCHLSGAILNGANLAGANLVEASLIGASIKGTDLCRVDLSGADLTGVSLSGSRLVGAYLVGAFLTESDLSRANLSGAFVRMARVEGSNISDAILDDADLSQADLAGVWLNGSSLVAANLSDANLLASSLTGCDLRGANLTGANLSGCNLTGARLSRVVFDGVRLDDAWADWVDASEDGGGQSRTRLEKVFGSILGRPIAQVIVEGRIRNEVWAEIVAHLCDFQRSHPGQSDIRLRAIHQGVSSSVLYLEADKELSLAAYLAEFSDIVGRGSIELFEKLASAVAAESTSGIPAAASIPAAHDPTFHEATRSEVIHGAEFRDREKAFVILTGRREIWLEAASGESLTLRPPRGAVGGLDVIRGRFVLDSHPTASSSKRG